MLWPGRRVALPPGSSLQYHLCKTIERVCWLPKDLDALVARTNTGAATTATRWSTIGPREVGSVSPHGIFSAANKGENDVSMRHFATKFLSAKAPLVVAHPRSLLLQAPDPPATAAARAEISRDPPTCLETTLPQRPWDLTGENGGNGPNGGVVYMLVGEVRFASLHVLATDPSSASAALLLNGSALLPLPLLPAPAGITDPHLRPSVHLAASSSPSSFPPSALSPPPPLTLDRATPPSEVGLLCSGAFDECLVGGAPPGAPPLATCECRALTATSVGATSLSATLAAAPDARWPALATALPLQVVGPLGIEKPSYTYPWVCANLADVSPPPLPAVVGGSGCVRWSTHPPTNGGAGGAGMSRP